MKIQSTHYEYMKQEIWSLDLDKVKEHKKGIMDGIIPCQNKAKRFRWDCFQAAHLSKWACDNLYAYVNDDHIDTALRQIVKELEI